MGRGKKSWDHLCQPLCFCFRVSKIVMAGPHLPALGLQSTTVEEHGIYLRHSKVAGLQRNIWLPKKLQKLVEELGEGLPACRRRSLTGAVRTQCRVSIHIR